MMRYLLTGIAAVIILAVNLSTPVFSADLKIGYVDTIKVFNEYQKTKDCDEVLAEKQKGKEEVREKKIKELKSLQDQFALLSDAEKEKKKTDIDVKLQDLDQFTRQAVMDLRKQQNEFMNEIADEIDKVVRKHAERGGFDFVLSGQAVLYGKGAYNLTDNVLKELNKNYKPKR